MSAVSESEFGARVLATTAGVTLAAAVVYLTAVVAGYVQAHTRPLYVVLLPLAALGALCIARYVARQRRPEAFYIAAVAGAVAGVLATATATAFQSSATDLAAAANRAVISRDFAIGIAKSQEATQRLLWSHNTVVLGFTAVFFLAVVVAASLAMPDGRKVIRSGSAQRVPLATVGAVVLTIAVCGWLLLRL